MNKSIIYFFIPLLLLIIYINYNIPTYKGGENNDNNNDNNNNNNENNITQENNNNENSEEHNIENNITQENDNLIQNNNSIPKQSEKHKIIKTQNIINNNDIKMNQELEKKIKLQEKLRIKENQLNNLKNKLDKKQTKINNEKAMQNSNQYILHNDNYLETMKKIKLINDKYNNIELMKHLDESIKNHNYQKTILIKKLINLNKDLSFAKQIENKKLINKINNEKNKTIKEINSLPEPDKLLNIHINKIKKKNNSTNNSTNNSINNLTGNSTTTPAAVPTYAPTNATTNNSTNNSANNSTNNSANNSTNNSANNSTNNSVNNSENIELINNIKLDEEKLMMHFDEIITKYNLLKNDINIETTELNEIKNDISNTENNIEKEIEMNTNNTSKMNLLKTKLEEDNKKYTEYETNIKHNKGQLILELNKIHKIKYTFIQDYYKKIEENTILSYNTNKIKQLEDNINNILNENKNELISNKPEEPGCYYFLDNCPLQPDNNNLYNWNLDKMSEKIDTQDKCNNTKKEYDELCGINNSLTYFVPKNNQQSQNKSMIEHIPKNINGECSSSNKCEGMFENNYCIGKEQSPGDGGCNKYCNYIAEGYNFYRGDLEGCVKNLCDNPTIKSCENKYFSNKCKNNCDELLIKTTVTTENNKIMIETIKNFYNSSLSIIKRLDRYDFKNSDEMNKLMRQQYNIYNILLKTRIANMNFYEYTNLFEKKYFENIDEDTKNKQFDNYLNNNGINVILYHQILNKSKIFREKLKVIIEKERIEKERIEKERIEQERLEIEQQRLEKERIEQERLEIEKQRIEQERLEK